MEEVLHSTKPYSKAEPRKQSLKWRKRCQTVISTDPDVGPENAVLDVHDCQLPVTQLTLFYVPMFTRVH